MAEIFVHQSTINYFSCFSVRVKSQMYVAKRPFLQDVQIHVNFRENLIRMFLIYSLLTHHFVVFKNNFISKKPWGHLKKNNLVLVKKVSPLPTWNKEVVHFQVLSIKLELSLPPFYLQLILRGKFQSEYRQCGMTTHFCQQLLG